MSRRSFNTIAEEYDRIRPTYPEELVEDVIAFAGLHSGARLLEVGCGTGKATVPFARRGMRLLCVEPGPNLVSLAERKLHAYPKVSIVTSTFEEWAPDPGEAFDLVFSGQAFYWVDPAIRYVKSASLLKPEGSLALFWYSPRPGDTSLDAAIREVYGRCAPLLTWSPTARSPTVKTEQQIDATGLFGPVFTRSYRRRRVYSTEEFISYLGTQSDHGSLPADEGASLFDGIREVMARSGERITLEFEFWLNAARKRAA